MGTGATAVTDGQQNHPAQLWKREEVLIEKYAATFVEEKYGVRIMPKPRTHAKRVLLTHNDSHTNKTCFTHAQ